MTDEELSVAVARIIYPEYKWEAWGEVAISDNDGMEFSYPDKDCAWDMVLWWTYNFHKYHKESGLAFILLSPNPQHDLAMAIIEAASGGLTDD